jgi:hypothetical protein
MTIEAIRFRAEGEFIVLQVLESQKRSGSYSYDIPAAWRDAKVEDMLDAARFTSALDVLQGMVNSVQLYVDSSKKVPEVRWPGEVHG